jgi:hypothetical protein
MTSDQPEPAHDANYLRRLIARYECDTARQLWRDLYEQKWPLADDPPPALGVSDCPSDLPKSKLKQPGF